MNEEEGQEQQQHNQNCEIKSSPLPLRPGKVYRVPIRRQQQYQADDRNNNNKEQDSNRILFTYKTWDAKANKWRPTETHTPYSDNNGTSHNFCYRIPLCRGGTLNIYPHLFPSKQVKEIKKELMACTYWRKYSIQGGDEPRLHFLLHEDATIEMETAENNNDKPKTPPSTMSASASVTTPTPTPTPTPTTTTTTAKSITVNEKEHNSDACTSASASEEQNFKYNTKQPGYRYANITMKARPLHKLKKLEELSKEIAILRQIPNLKWNIGVHSVL